MTSLLYNKLFHYCKSGKNFTSLWMQSECKKKKDGKTLTASPQQMDMIHTPRAQSQPGLVPWFPLIGCLSPMFSYQTANLFHYFLLQLSSALSPLNCCISIIRWTCLMFNQLHYYPLTHNAFFCLCPSPVLSPHCISSLAPHPLPLTSHFLSPSPLETLWLRAVRVCQIH